MEIFIYEGIRIEGAFSLQTLLEFTMDVEPNCHARAVIKGIFADAEALQRWQYVGDTHEVRIYLEKDKKILFCGVLNRVEWKCEAGVCQGELHVISASAALDVGKEAVSFQNVEMTYEEILNKAFETVPGSVCNCVVGKSEGPGVPLIQYRETDWEFALRLASILNTVIYPEPCVATPYIWFGIPEGNVTVKPTTSQYIHGLSEKYYELAGTVTGVSKDAFEYYQVETRENYEVGVMAEYAGITWRILEKHVRLSKGELLYRYLLGHESLVMTTKQCHGLFAGMSILGKVIHVEDECVRLHLDIDKEQDVSTAYPYKWVPDTGSVMYCMPELDSTVALYFPNEDESGAIVVSCVRHNSDTCPAIAETEKRVLTTAEGKRMYINPDEVGFDISKQEHCMKLVDESGISLGSGKKVSITAIQGVEVKAKVVVLETPQEINLMRGQLMK